jgi:hypothetical protein
MLTGILALCWRSGCGMPPSRVLHHEAALARVSEAGRRSRGWERKSPSHELQGQFGYSSLDEYASMKYSDAACIFTGPCREHIRALKGFSWPNSTVKVAIEWSLHRPNQPVHSMTEQPALTAASDRTTSDGRTQQYIVPNPAVCLWGTVGHSRHQNSQLAHIKRRAA